jgi:multidrug resistance efflux pump
MTPQASPPAPTVQPGLSEAAHEADTVTVAPPAGPRPTPAPATSPRRSFGTPALPPAAPPRSHHLLRVLLTLVVLVVVSAGAYWLYTARPWIVVGGPLVASGTLEADEVLVGTEVNGRILGLAREGQAVQAGQVVAQLDDSLIQLQMRQVDSATQQQLVIQADRYQLRSPISGVVTRVPVHTGEVAAAGQTVVAVADLNALEMTAYVLERDLGRVKVGQEVAISADPFPGRTFNGVVTSTNQRAEFTPRNVQTQRDRLNLVFGVKIRVENPQGELKPGMPADASFPAQ